MCICVCQKMTDERASVIDYGNVKNMVLACLYVCVRPCLSSFMFLCVYV